MVNKLDINRLAAGELIGLLEAFNDYYDHYTPATSVSEADQLAGMIDHTILKPDATYNEIDNLCREALQYRFASVCVNSSYVERCSKTLERSGVKVCSVVGFPLGAASTEVKVFETDYVIRKGSSEVDMVINIGALRSKNYIYLFKDIKEVVNAAHRQKAICKVIIETCLLLDDEKIAACLIAREAGCDFVKTSTGFSKGGADKRDVTLMKYLTGSTVKVKASGGIRTTEDALTMISHGADRIGTSSGVKIIDSFRTTNKV